MGRGTADESEEASDKPFEWSESDAPGDSRRSSVKGNKGKAKAMMRVVSPGVDELLTTAETRAKRRSQPEALFESPEMPTMALAKAIPGILKKPSKQPDSRGFKVHSMAKAHPQRQDYDSREC
ncbi:hypothetical protein BDN67DRAFT_1016665 [Paxillus ammoniavirescens]|nr:hypothetical protein BDN67DRAFT_1016665 [Paxillus ammoniavirescens]